MNEIISLVCTACPVGCHLKVHMAQAITVENAQCSRGIIYGKKEVTNPTRIVTSTVIIKGAILNRLPVRTQSDIPKKYIFDCMKAINRVKVEAPVKMGQVIIKDVASTGVDIIASRSMKRV